MTIPCVIELTEYKPLILLRSALADEEATLIGTRYQEQVDLRVEMPLTTDSWRLTSNGWIGQIPLSPRLQLRLQPKTPLHTVFGMFEYAYRLRDFKFLQGITPAQSLQEFYSQLAKVLARRILDRSRQGFYRSYQTEEDQLAYVSGRLDIMEMAAKPWNVHLKCQFQEHTSDIDDNRILTWTLRHILRSGYCQESTSDTVRQAYRVLHTATSLLPFTAQDCVNRLYQRLNQDYRPLHALCRFFLENSGPSHAEGEHDMLPFLVNMAGLFELFVAEWLNAHLPEPWTVKTQEIVSLDPTGLYQFRPDLVVYNRYTDEVRCVLDTKYKVKGEAEHKDIAQVIAYAHLKQAREAVLIYPNQLAAPLDVQSNGIRIRSVAFNLDRDLEVAGLAFLDSLHLWSAV